VRLLSALCMHACLAVQIVQCVTEGRQLEMPPPDRLPGATCDFQELPAYANLVGRCCSHNPEDRPTFNEIEAELR
jgi:hypothetical protein